MNKIVVLISGRGSNMENLVSSDIPGKFVLVASNNPHAGGLKRAKNMGIRTAIVDHKTYSNRQDFDLALAKKLEEYEPDLILLAGFMRVLSKQFLSRFENKVLNIHPSLLPAFPGQHSHKQAIKKGVRIHGCTVHFVTPSLDAGPIIVQSAIPVNPKDDEESLAKKVLEQEHQIYPIAVKWFLEKKLRIKDDKVFVDEDPKFSSLLSFRDT